MYTSDNIFSIELTQNFSLLKELTPILVLIGLSVIQYSVGQLFPLSRKEPKKTLLNFLHFSLFTYKCQLEYMWGFKML